MEEAKLLINGEADTKEVTAMLEIFRWHNIRTRRTFELTYVEGTKRSVYLRESPKMVEEPRIEIVR